MQKIKITKIKFLAGMNPQQGQQNSFFEQLFPKKVYKNKTASLYIICLLIDIYIIQLLLS